MTENWYSEETATFGDRVTAAREAAGMSPGELARRLGVREATAAAWEADQTHPRGNRMQMLAGVLNVSLKWLMTGTGPGLAPPQSDAQFAALAALRNEMGAIRSDLLRQAEHMERLDRKLRRVMAAAEAAEADLEPALGAAG